MNFFIFFILGINIIFVLPQKIFFLMLRKEKKWWDCSDLQQAKKAAQEKVLITKSNKMFMLNEKCFQTVSCNRKRFKCMTVHCLKEVMWRCTAQSQAIVLHTRHITPLKKKAGSCYIYTFYLGWMRKTLHDIFQALEVLVSSRSKAAKQLLTTKHHWIFWLILARWNLFYCQIIL